MKAKPVTTLRELLDTLPRNGEVTWIGVRPARHATMVELEEVIASPESGLAGDRYQGRSGKRQVTLMQAEHLPVIASYLGRENVAAGDFRRNILVAGINLLALKDQVIAIGEVELEVTGLCHPCSHMEQTFGPGGYNAVRSHGGITARVLTGGRIAIGDPVRLSATDRDI